MAMALCWSGMSVRAEAAQRYCELFAHRMDRGGLDAEEFAKERAYTEEVLRLYGEAERGALGQSEVLEQLMLLQRKRSEGLPANAAGKCLAIAELNPKLAEALASGRRDVAAAFRPLLPLAGKTVAAASASLQSALSRARFGSDAAQNAFIEDRNCFIANLAADAIEPAARTRMDLSDFGAVKSCETP